VTAASKAGQRLAQRIEADILRTGQGAGDRLGSELELIAHYGTSRTLFREAVRLLEHDGICAMRRGPGGGLYVVEMDSNAVSHAAALWLHFTDAPVADLYEVRKVLETRCAAWAAERIDGAGAARLQQSRLAEERAATEGDADAFAAAVNEFHVTVAEVAGNAVAVLFVRVLSELNHAYTGTVAYSPEEVAAVLGAHRAIAEAIVSGDPVLAAYRSVRHMHASGAFLEAVAASRRAVPH
jgi:DNA-binding FadR family transcriptional regulator